MPIPKIIRCAAMAAKQVLKLGGGLFRVSWTGVPREFRCCVEFGKAKEMNPHRRVVNTFDAFCLIEAAQEETHVTRGV